MPSGMRAARCGLSGDTCGNTPMQHTTRPLQDALNKSVLDFSVPLSNSVWERSFAAQ